MNALVFFLCALVASWACGLFLASRRAASPPPSFLKKLPPGWIAHFVLSGWDPTPAFLSFAAAAALVLAGLVTTGLPALACLLAALLILAPVPFILFSQGCARAKEGGREVVLFNPLRPNQAGTPPPLALYIEESQWLKISGQDLRDFEYWQRFCVAPGLYICPATPDMLQEIDSLNLYRYLVQPQNPYAMEAFKRALLGVAPNRKDGRRGAAKGRRPGVAAQPQSPRPTLPLPAQPTQKLPDQPQFQPKPKPEPAQEAALIKNAEAAKQLPTQSPAQAQEEPEKSQAKKRPLRERLPGLMGRPVAQNPSQASTAQASTQGQSQRPQTSSQPSSQALSSQLGNPSQPQAQAQTSSTTGANPSTNANLQKPEASTAAAASVEAERLKALARAQAQARMASTQAAQQQAQARQQQASEPQQRQQSQGQTQGNPKTWNDKNWQESGYDPALERPYDPIFEPLVGPLEKMKMQMKARQAAAERTRQARLQQSQRQTGGNGNAAAQQAQQKLQAERIRQEQIARAQSQKPQTDGSNEGG